MPSTRKSNTGSSSFSAKSISIPFEKGHIIGVELSDDGTSLNPAQAYGIISVSSSETPNPIPNTFLSAGYFGKGAKLGWSGRLKAEPTSTITAIFYGRLDVQFTLSVHTEVS